MYQLYALSVILGILAGISVSFSWLDERLKLSKFLSAEGFTDSKFRFVLGLISGIVGVFKLFVPLDTGVIIIGDFIPAAVNIVLGLILILSFYLEGTASRSETVAKFEQIFLRNSNVFGILGIVLSIVHLFLGTALFL